MTQRHLLLLPPWYLEGPARLPPLASQLLTVHGIFRQHPIVGSRCAAWQWLAHGEPKELPVASNCNEVQFGMNNQSPTGMICLALLEGMIWFVILVLGPFRFVGTHTRKHELGTRLRPWQKEPVGWSQFRKQTARSRCVGHTTIGIGQLWQPRSASIS